MKDEPHNSVLRISQKDYEDYEFVALDILKHIRRPLEDQIRQLRADPRSLLGGLKGTHGTTLPLSRDAQIRFIQIAKRGIKKFGTTAHLHRLDTVVQALKDKYSISIIGGFEVTSENAHEIFDSALEGLQRTYADLTYHVPCSVVVERNYPTFTIGPVTFTLSDDFFKLHEAAIKVAVDGVGTQSVTEALHAGTLSFYSQFQWIASITVPPCDREISRRRARAGIQNSLNAIKLIIGSDRAAHVKQGYDLTTPTTHAELVSASGGSLSLSLGRKLKDAITNENWYEQITALQAWPLLQSVLLNYWNEWQNLDEIQIRFLDGLSWHSDAISEPNLGARIVKFWTAIERLLSLSPGAKIAARAAVLASNNAEEFSRHSKKLETLYQRRSSVVHGDSNRADEEWHVEAAAGSEAASQCALFQYLYSIPRILACPENTDRRKLDEWLKWLDRIAKGYRRIPRGMPTP